ncbi:hypothetical protein [Methylosinus sp. RM1]|uniref:hypothetical protein n=1 Tax=Methylosinus sp. RM1 TaxID=2583817 RepID=UPI00140B7CDB|nr:hypothetical protein [Methylosinus sp. RM1]
MIGHAAISPAEDAIRRVASGDEIMIERVVPVSPARLRREFKSNRRKSCFDCGCRKFLLTASARVAYPAAEEIRILWGKRYGPRKLFGESVVLASIDLFDA